MNLDDVVILTDREVKGLYHDVYNGFWLKYRDNPPDLQSPEWEKIVECERMLRERYNSCPLVLHMIQDLMDQLEARSRDGKEVKMETSIFERDEKTWTRFKVKTKELWIYAHLLKKWVDINKPVKQSSRYLYFEVEGDLLNN